MLTTHLHTLLRLIVIAACALSLSPAYADDSQDPQTITLDRSVYFSTAEGRDRQLSPGAYRVTPLSDQLEVTPIDGDRSPIHLTMTLDIHEQELAEPMAVSVPGSPEQESNDRHIIALFLPGGLAYEARGTYSGIRPRALDPQALITDPMDIHLERTVHFAGADGEPLIIQPGTYRAEPAGEHIRLANSAHPDGMVLEAISEPEDEPLDAAVTLSLPGNAEDEADLHHLVLMETSGTSLYALGTYSGIQERGPFKKFGSRLKKTVKRAKRTVRRTGAKARQTARRVGKTAKQKAQEAARLAKKAALDAKKKAEWVAKQAAQGALIAAKAVCKAGLTAAKVSAKVQEKLLGPIKKELAKALKLPKAQKALREAIASIRAKQGEAIQRTIDAATILASAKNSRTVKQLMDPNTMCEKPGKTVQSTFKKMVGGPIRQALAVVNTGSASGVRSRGSFASASIALGGNAAKVGGGELGVRFAFDFVNKAHWFLDLAGMVKSNVGGGGGVEIGIFPKKDPVDTGGWFLGAGISFPLPKVPPAMGGGLDFYFDFPLEIKTKPFKMKWNLTSAKFFLDHFQGFGVSFGGGKNALPADFALKTGVGIRLSKK